MRSRCSIFCLLTAVFIVIGLSATTVHAQAPSDDGLFYYKLGGAEPLTRAPNKRMNSTTLGANVHWNNPFSCGAGHFDPMATVSNQLNGITQGFQNLMSSVISSATGAVAGLPGLILARSNPDVYDILQKGIVGAKTDISFAEASCEEVQNIMTGDQGLDFEKWVKISALDDWRHQMQTQPDVIQAKRNIDANAGNSGTAWVGGVAAGGTAQPAIHVNRDVVAAGYNTVLNRAVADTTRVPDTSPLFQTPIAIAWQQPQDAAQWSVDVLGDSVIATCDGCEKKQSIPGKGLVTKYEEERDLITPLLQDLIAARVPINHANLEAVSAKPSIVMTPDLITAIREEKDGNMLAGRLANEIAMMRTMERSIHLRRLLQAGRREANVAANGPAQQEIQRVLDDLKIETDDLLYEMTLREKVTSNTAAKLLERLRQRRIQTSSKQYIPPVLKGGSVP